MTGLLSGSSRTRRLFLPRIWSATWRRWHGFLAQIERHSVAIAGDSDEALRRRSLGLRYRAFSGQAASRLLGEAYALMREAATRTLGLRHFDVQLLGGIALHHPAIAEMQTGEGKTLTALFPLYLAAIQGRGAHLATANDYLAARDAELVRPAFELLGQTVGVIQSSTARPERQQAYGCDVTYAAAREFGFDFLRDRLLTGRLESGNRNLLGRMLGHDKGGPGSETIQRELYFILVDEADSILVDEARTPLIVSALSGASPETTKALFFWSSAATAAFSDEDDFHYDPQKRKLNLTAQGRQRVRQLERPPALTSVPLFDLYVHIERALRVEREFERDRHYVVRDGEVIIVDENTGRLADGRKWRDGVHQAVEAREGLNVSPSNGEAARVTVQEFFLRYQRLAGMTGTAWSARGELQKIYDLQTHAIPTHRTCRRQQWDDAVHGSQDDKWDAILEEVRQLNERGRPVLIGTRTIEKSEYLSQLLRAASIEHDVLNAHRHSEEADVVAKAGNHGKVTVATNMAGRGTDIRLGDGVAESGGLHVICSELHESARIDRQLIGRCARQGDPGSYRQYMSLDDDIVRVAFGRQKAERMRKVRNRVQMKPAKYIRLLRSAQARVEQKHFQQRRLLMYHEKRRRELQREMGQDPFLDAS
jgi:preprotein translocase subunit SecA